MRRRCAVTGPLKGLADLSALMVVAVAVLLFASIVPHAKAYANGELAGADAASLQEQSDSPAPNFYFDKDRIAAIDATGVVAFNEKTRTLTLKNARFSAVDLRGCETVTVKLLGENVGDILSADGTKCAVTITGSGSLAGLIESHDVTVKSGKVKGAVRCSNAFSMTGGALTFSSAESNGAVSCGTFAMSGGSLRASGSKCNHVVNCEGAFAMSGGRLVVSGAEFGVSAAGKMEVSGGTVLVKRTTSGAIDCKKLAVNGGKVLLRSCNGYGLTCNGLSLRKGVISVDDQYNANYDEDGHASVLVEHGNLFMSGGALKVTRSHQTAIEVTAKTVERYEGVYVNYGGRFKVTGGTLVAKTFKPEERYAIIAHSMSSKVSFKGVRGGVQITGDAGMKFASGGSTYKIVGTNAVLLSYGGKATKVNLDSAKFAGRLYPIVGIGTKAFATKSGAKVSSIKLEWPISEIGARAFAGTKSLKTLQFGGFAQDPFSSTRIAWSKNANVAKSAFAKCGKNGGGSLMVSFVEGNVTQAKARAYRKLFISKGMSKQFTLATEG